jgi:hypothetical protein
MDFLLNTSNRINVVNLIYFRENFVSTQTVHVKFLVINNKTPHFLHVFPCNA